MIRYQLYCEEEKKVIYETYNGVQALIVDVAMNYGGHTKKDAIRLSILGYQAYLKADTNLDLGRFVDYLAEIENVNEFEKLTRSQILDDFYEKQGYF